MQTKFLAAIMEVRGVGKTFLPGPLKLCELLGGVLAGRGGAVRDGQAHPSGHAVSALLRG